MPPPRQTQVRADGIVRRVEREADGVVLWKPEYDLMQNSREAGVPGIEGGLDVRRAWEEEGGAEAAGDVDAGVLFVADGRGRNGPGEGAYEARSGRMACAILWTVMKACTHRVIPSLAGVVLLAATVASVVLNFSASAST